MVAVPVVLVVAAPVVLVVAAPVVLVVAALVVLVGWRWRRWRRWWRRPSPRRRCHCSLSSPLIVI